MRTDKRKDGTRAVRIVGASRNMEANGYDLSISLGGVSSSLVRRLPSTSPTVRVVQTAGSSYKLRFLTISRNYLGNLSLNYGRSSVPYLLIDI